MLTTQNNPWVKDFPILAADENGNRLVYLDSADKRAGPRYTFGSGAIPTGNTRPSNYFTTKPKPTDVIIQIFHTADGRMVALNFGKNGYMVTMVRDQETTCVRDGNCLPS